MAENTPTKNSAFEYIGLNFPGPSPAVRAFHRISSLEKNPENPGIPAMAMHPIRNVRYVWGILEKSWPIFRMSCSPLMAWITAPDPRNSSALKNACVYRWNTPAAYAPTPTPRNMNPRWLTVQYARPFFMLFCTSPIEAAKSAVTHPTPATTIIAVGLMLNSPLLRATRYTPLVTIVAAWISALTGVGPAIASGSHTYKGICALLPVAPTNSRIADAVITHVGIVPVTAIAFTCAM